MVKSLQHRLVFFLLLPDAVFLFIMGFAGFLYARKIMLGQWTEAAIVKLSEPPITSVCVWLKPPIGLKCFIRLVETGYKRLTELDSQSIGRDRGCHQGSSRVARSRAWEKHDVWDAPSYKRSAYDVFSSCQNRRSYRAEIRHWGGWTWNHITRFHSPRRIREISRQPRVGSAFWLFKFEFPAACSVGWIQGKVTLNFISKAKPSWRDILQFNAGKVHLMEKHLKMCMPRSLGSIQ